MTSSGTTSCPHQFQVTLCLLEANPWSCLHQNVHDEEFSVDRRDTQFQFPGGHRTFGNETPTQVIRVSVQTSPVLLPAPWWFFVWLTLQPWKRRWYALLKRRLTLTRLHSDIRSQDNDWLQAGQLRCRSSSPGSGEILLQRRSDRF
jgi:hypothetical protein